MLGEKIWSNFGEAIRDDGNEIARGNNELPGGGDGGGDDGDLDDDNIADHVDPNQQGGAGVEEDVGAGFLRGGGVAAAAFRFFID